MIPVRRWFFLGLALLCAVGRAQAASALPPATAVGAWQMQDATRVSETGAQLSRPGFTAPHWYKATVPGTVLTTLVDNGVYPEPLYGENNRQIPESLCRKDWWYRTHLVIPADYAGQKIWLHFDGINFAAEVWVNGSMAGSIKGAFTRGIFDISSLVTRRTASRAGGPRFSSTPSRHSFRAHHCQWRPRQRGTARH